MTNRFAVLASMTGVFTLAWVAAPASTAAESRTGKVDVSTTVVASCNINAATLVFASYDPVNTHATATDDATGEITVRCTSGATGITIDLDAGKYNGGTAQRQMANTGNASVLLPYQIHQGSDHQTIWGVAAGGTVRSGTDLNGTGANVTVTMYGRIPAGQLQAISGSYSDTLVSTINF
jgi:spore coat protein U-like protein